MKTVSFATHQVEKQWYVIDASQYVLGRLATEVARRLRGKHKPQFTPHADVGDFIIILNAEKVRSTGSKLEKKRYYRYSGYPGGMKTQTLEEKLKRAPTEVIELAVKRMLPRSPLGYETLRKLKIYAGPEHPHAAQQPIPLSW